MTTFVWFQSVSGPKKVTPNPDEDYGEIFTCPVCNLGYTYGPDYKPCTNPECNNSVARVLHVIEGGHSQRGQLLKASMEAMRR